MIISHAFMKFGFNSCLWPVYTFLYIYIPCLSLSCFKTNRTFPSFFLISNPTLSFLLLLFFSTSARFLRCSKESQHLRAWVRLAATSHKFLQPETHVAAKNKPRVLFYHPALLCSCCSVLSWAEATWNTAPLSPSLLLTITEVILSAGRRLVRRVETR